MAPLFVFPGGMTSSKGKFSVRFVTGECPVDFGKGMENIVPSAFGALLPDKPSPAG